MTGANRIPRALFILSVLGFLLAPARLFAYELQYAESGDVVRWWESCFYYTIHEDGSDDVPIEDLRRAIRSSFDAWEDTPCSYFYFEETEEDATCSPIGFDLKKSNMNLLVWREEAWRVDKDHDTGVIALTTLSYDDNSGRILDADIEFNGEYFRFSASGAQGFADIQNTATHEIGHTIGLGHSRTIGSTMAPTADTGDVDKRNLHADDIAGVCDLYPLEEDPGICKEPYCGLDQHCAGSECETGRGIETTPSTISEPRTGCTVATPAARGARFFDLARRLLLTF